VTQVLDTLSEIASDYGAVVFDQWGVLHDGSAPYPCAGPALATLVDAGHTLAVLSNSGKRATVNAAQLEAIGFPSALFACVMTSGEVLWRAFAAGGLPYEKLYAITRAPGDAEDWADGLGVAFVPVAEAEALLLMGLADTAGASAYADVFAAALERRLPVLCSNPDRTAPRAGGTSVVMPGTLAQHYADNGGDVRFIGKPHLEVFRAVEEALDLSPENILLVGDSLEHDIAGARAAGWHSVFVQGGLHAKSFGTASPEDTLAELAHSLNAPPPEFTLDIVR